MDKVACPTTYNGLSTYIIYSTGTIMYVVYKYMHDVHSIPPLGGKGGVHLVGELD